MTGIELIAQERTEQIIKHNRTVYNDVENNNDNQIMRAVMKLLIAYNKPPKPPKYWAANIWNKMINKPHKEQLIIAAALIAAEVDRLTEIENRAVWYAQFKIEMDKLNMTACPGFSNYIQQYVDGYTPADAASYWLPF